VVVWGALAAAVVAYCVDLRGLFSRSSPPEATPAVPDVGPIEGPQWPQLRGPRYDGISEETGLADSWPPEGPPVLWAREIGRGYSALTVAGDRAFTQRQTTTDQTVLCLHAETGQTLWEHRYGWPYEPGGLYPGPRATPT
jgi:hypothetical protein